MPDTKTTVPAEQSPNKSQDEQTEKETLEKQQPAYDLKKFELNKILQNNTRNKSIVLLGTFPDNSETDQAIVLLEKQAFKEADVQTTKDAEEPSEEEKENGDKIIENNSSYFNKDLEINMEFVNNIYGNYQCSPSNKLNSIKATVVYPATPKHIEKYSICQKYLIQETPELYERITLPYITSSQFSLEWVYNILEHKQEVERIVYENNDPENGFILLPDLKWDGKNVETLYLLAITHKRNIKSLRDLTADHLPLLRNIRTQAAKAIEERYGLKLEQLRMYFHYQPSFYHLHIHFNPLRNEAPGIWCEKSHMLDTVINNLELLSDYYKKATLPFMVFDGSKFLEQFDKELKITTRKRALEEKNDGNDENDGKRVKLDAEQNVNSNVHDDDKSTAD